MKANFLTAIMSTSLLLSACGGNHDHPKAVDKLEEAQAAALAKAPKAEEVKFDDHGQPTMGGVGGAAGANTNTAPTAEHVAGDLATADAQTTAHHGQADAAAANTQTQAATADASTAISTSETTAAATAEAATAEAPTSSESTATENKK